MAKIDRATIERVVSGELKQIEAARLMGVSKQAVSQYLIENRVAPQQTNGLQTNNR